MQTIKLSGLPELLILFLDSDATHCVQTNFNQCEQFSILFAINNYYIEKDFLMGESYLPHSKYSLQWQRIPTEHFAKCT